MLSYRTTIVTATPSGEDLPDTTLVVTTIDTSDSRASQVDDVIEPSLGNTVALIEYAHGSEVSLTLYAQSAQRTGTTADPSP